MKKQYLPLVLALALCQNVSAQSRFDASSQMYADHYLDFVREPGAILADMSSMPFSLNANSRSELTADVFVHMSEGTTVEDLENYGMEVRTVLGPVAICHGTLDDIIALAETDLSIEMSFSRKLDLKLNVAREKTGTAAIHLGEEIAQPYKGEGVITGIFDIGMDPNHVNFKDADSYSRISNFWHYTSTNGNPVRYNGTTITRFSTDAQYQSHGTHTMGCLAGSYNGNGNYGNINASGRGELITDAPLPFYGMAPEAEIIAACDGNGYQTNIADALLRMATYIQQSGQPGLLSLSFGSNTGPHDGTEVYAYALNEVAKMVPLFIAAGNEGGDDMSIIGDFTESTPQFKTALNLSQATPTKGSISIWAADNRPVTVKLAIVQRNRQEILYELPISDASSTVTLATSSMTGSSYIYNDDFDAAFSGSSSVKVTPQVNSANNRYNVQITYELTRATSSYVLGIIVEGEPGQHFDLVHNCESKDSYGRLLASLSGYNMQGWLDGGNEMSISGLACGEDMICVGAWNTRKRWAQLNKSVTGYSGTGYDEDDIAIYSSYGTLADGTTRPHVVAPGSGIVSSMSSYYINYINGANACVASAEASYKTHYWDAMQGTSMATPVAAGIAALWLQANPNLTPKEIKYIIEQTSTVDENVLNSDRRIAWGAGKINALEGLKMAVKIGAGVSDVVVNPADIIITGNGNNWQVVAPGAAAVKTVVYDLNGRPVITSDVKGDTAEICGENLQPGIYVINVNGTLSRRVAVK